MTKIPREITPCIRRKKVKKFRFKLFMKILYGGVGHPQHAYVLPAPLRYAFEDVVRHSCGMYPW